MVCGSRLRHQQAIVHCSRATTRIPLTHTDHGRRGGGRKAPDGHYSTDGGEVARGAPQRQEVMIPAEPEEQESGFLTPPGGPRLDDGTGGKLTNERWFHAIRSPRGELGSFSLPDARARTRC